MEKEKLLYAAIGAVLSSILIPIVTYFFIRIYNTCRVRVTIEPGIQNLENMYWTHSLVVRNRAGGTLKNVVAFIEIDYNEFDIANNEEFIKTYSVFTPNRPLMLSWAKMVDDRNLASIDINQGEWADLNLIRYHMNSSLPLIQVAAENGFYYDKWANKGRMLLKSHRDYHFTIHITADNCFPIRVLLIFNQMSMRIER